MLIFSPEISTRLKFTAEFIFQLRGLEFRLTNDRSEYEEFKGVKLNYSAEKLQGPSLEPSFLLFEENIRTDLKIGKATWEGQEILSFNGAVDPFASIFFVLSRYEEYIDSRRDAHDRFDPKNSWQFKFGWLEQAIADHWAEQVIATFDAERFQFIQRRVVVVPTFDIDNTFAFKWKDGWRKTLAVTKDRVRLQSGRIAMRRKVLSGETDDPYDGFEKITSIATRFPNTRIFWHVGDYGKFDRNISIFDTRHRQLIRDISLNARIGIHPSYASNSSDLILKEELHRLEEVLGKKVHGSRQHFLKLKLPTTYRRLLSHRLKSDYSMGYAQLPGFRIGTARPVMFFDLEQNVPTELQIIPFVYMDGTLNEYMCISPEVAKDKITALYEEIKAFGGVFSFIWHNETITDHGKWNGWSEVLEHSLYLVKDAD